MSTEPDVVKRAREAVADLEDRDEPFCRDCMDAHVGDVWAHTKTRLGLLYGFWMQIGEEVPSNGTSIGLPALLIWHPDWAGE